MAYLEAPVPLLAGLTKQPHVQGADRFLIVNTYTGEVQCTKPLPKLPGDNELVPRLESVLRKSKLTQPPLGGVKRVFTSWLFSEDSSRVMESFSRVLKTHFLKLFENFESYCITEVGKTSSVSVFMRESFIESAPLESKDFLKDFMGTQIFINYEDTRLRLLDIEKTYIHNN